MTTTSADRRAHGRDSKLSISEVDNVILQPAGTEEVQRPWLHSATAWITTAVQVSTAVAGAAYGFGWLTAARFYGHFGVSPEEVGISFGWLAIRAFLIALVSLALFLATRFLLQMAERYKAPVWTANRRTVTATLLLLSLGLTVGTDILLIKRGFGSSSGEILVLAVIPLSAVVLILALRKRAQSATLTVRGTLGVWLRGVAGGLAGFVVTILAMMPVRIADDLSNSVRRGEAARLVILPGVPVLQMERARLLPATYPQPSPPSDTPCVVRLGGGGGTSVYWDIDRQQVLRISDETVIAATPC